MAQEIEVKLTMDRDQLEQAVAGLSMIVQEFQTALEGAQAQEQTPQAAAGPVGGKPPRQNEVDMMMQEAMGLGPQ